MMILIERFPGSDGGQGGDFCHPDRVLSGADVADRPTIGPAPDDRGPVAKK
jgi:hypothetical protein